MDFKEKKERLNALMIEYSQLKDDPANVSRCKNLKNEATNIMLSSDFFKILENKVKEYMYIYTIHAPYEFVTDAFLHSAKYYNNNRSDNYYNFFWKCLRQKIVKTLKKKEPDRVRENMLIDSEGNQISIFDFIEAVGEDVESTTINDLQSDDKPIYEEELFFIKLIAVVAHAKKHHEKNAKSKNYQHFRTFATSEYIFVCKKNYHLLFEINENDAFDIMDVEFADFVLTEKCRNFSKFMEVPCKKYSDIGIYPDPNKNNQEQWVGEIYIPFRNPVYAIYFNVSDSRVDQIKDAFYDEFSNIKITRRIYR